MFVRRTKSLRKKFLPQRLQLDVGQSKIKTNQRYDFIPVEFKQ